MTSTRSPGITAARALTMLLATALSLWSMPALAQARPERLSDKDVKTLIDRSMRDATSSKATSMARSRGRRCADRTAR